MAFIFLERHAVNKHLNLEEIIMESIFLRNPFFIYKRNIKTNLRLEKYNSKYHPEFLAIYRQ